MYIHFDQNQKQKTKREEYILIHLCKLVCFITVHHTAPSSLSHTSESDTYLQL